MHDLETHGEESIWLKVNIKHSQPFPIGFVYRNPAEFIEWQERFNSPMDDVLMMNREVILFGDFNIDLLKPKPKWIQTYTTHGLDLLTDRPTRITDQKETLTDHIYVTSKQYLTEVRVPDSISAAAEIVSPTSVSTATSDAATIEQTGQPRCTPMITLD